MSFFSLSSLKISRKIIFLFVAIAAFTFVTVVSATHAWGKYHWDKSTEESTANPLQLGNNLTTSDWNNSLSQTSADWNLSVLKNEVTAGAGGSNCDPTSGRVEVCNGEYGEIGWLGIASIWVQRGRSGHIVQGVVKVNDTYFNTAPYNSQAWRDSVFCQEVGHTLGLGHQDEDSYNANLGTCMDYTTDPDGTLFGQLDNRYPNQHDYDMMAEIYAHLNSIDDGGGGGNGNGKGNGKGKPAKAGVGATIDLNDPSEWGEAIRQDAQGKNSLYRRNLPNGELLITHVIWANTSSE